MLLFLGLQRERPWAEGTHAQQTGSSTPPFAPLQDCESPWNLVHQQSQRYCTKQVQGAAGQCETRWGFGEAPTLFRLGCCLWSNCLPACVPLEEGCGRAGAQGPSPKGHRLSRLDSHLTVKGLSASVKAETGHCERMRTDELQVQWDLLTCL